VSHDLRNPLSVILMGARLLERGELNPNQRAVLVRLTNSAGRAQRLITDLLDFTTARIGQGLAVSPAPIELHELVASSVEELAAAFPGRRLEHHRVGDGACSADADRLIQLIGNLVSNAMAYGAPDKPVGVTSSVVADGFEISVHNEGNPIAPELVSRLFEPMVRGPGSGAASGVASGAASGVGLGLFIVRTIAQAHGANVFVTSSEHAGTTFHARFPAVEITGEKEMR
jgi:sigma-B regulation protein RsbU (phosphoserine phosphatase)